MPEIIPQLFTPPSALGGTIAFGEPEVLAGRRAFGMAQILLEGSPSGVSQSLTVGWYDSSVHPETGAFACVRDGAGQDDLIGEVVRVSFGGRQAFAYVMQAVSLPPAQDIALYRRAFAAIARLSLEQITADVVAVEG